MLLALGSSADADEGCGTGEIEFSSRGPTWVHAGDQGRGFGGRSPFFDQVCNEFIDTEHFRLHYSTLPGSVSIPGTAIDVAVSGDRALVAAESSGLHVVDIGVPGRPVVVASVPIPGSPRRVVTNGEIAVVLADNAIHIIRMADPVSIAGRVQFASSPRGLAIEGKTAYVVRPGRLEIIAASNPEEPVRIAELPLPGDLLDVAVAGERIAVAAGEAGIVVIDGSDQVHPRIEAIVDTPGIATGVAIEDPLIYVADGLNGLGVIRLGWEGWNLVGTLPAPGVATRVIAKDRLAFVIRAGKLVLVDCSPAEQPQVLDQATFLGEATGVGLGEEYAFVTVRDHGLQAVSTIAPDGELWLRQIQDQIHGWPDTGLRDTLAVAFERAYDVFQTMGFRPPIKDGDLGGGKDLVDCYIYNLPPDGGLAYTHPEDPVAGDCTSTFFGHLGIDNVGVISPNRLKDVAAHELFHLVQYAYDRFEATWLLESTAVWAERHVRPSLALGGDVRCWFTTPYATLWSRNPSCRMYGSVHFWLFQEQTTDESIVRRCFERCCAAEVDWLSALKSELTERGLDFNRQLAEFSRWNYATEQRDDGRHYRQEIRAAVDFQAEHTALPVLGAAVDPLAESTGANYVQFHGPGRRDSLRVTFAGDPALREWREVTLVATRARNVHREWILDLDKDGRAQGVIPDWPAYDSACLIVANGDTIGSALGAADYRFTYSAVETGASPITAVARAAPNPTSDETTIGLRIAEDRQAVRLDLYDASGRIVRRLADQTLDRGDHRLTWDGTTDDGRSAPSGVYFYEMTLGDEIHRGRLTIVR
jgi:hypothetical protein